MALVNRKIGVSSNKWLSRITKRAMYDNKYFENTEKFYRNLEYQRDIDKYQNL